MCPGTYARGQEGRLSLNRARKPNASRKFLPRTVALAGLLLAVFFGGEARAWPRLSVARGAGAQGCPEADALRQQVEAVLGRPVFASEPVDTGFDIEIGAIDDGGFVATIRVTGARRGQRTLRDTGPGCEGLGDAVALSVAMMLDGRAPIESPAPPPPTTPPVEPARRDEPRPSSTLRVWVVGGATSGLLTSPSPYIGGGVELLRGQALVGLGAIWTPEQRISLGPGAVAVGLTALKARGCVRVVPAVAGCGLLGAGYFRAVGVEYKQNDTVAPLWVAAGLGVQIGSRVAGPVGWTLQLDGLASLREQRFWVDEVGTTPPLPRVGVMLAAGLWAQIW